MRFATLSACVSALVLSGALSGCGGDDGDGGSAASPADVLTCLTEEHGLKATEAGVPSEGLRHTTGAIEVTSTGNSATDPTAVGRFAPTFSLFFYDSAEWATKDLDYSPSGSLETVIADTVVAHWFESSFGAAGPPELADVEDCVGT
jgi:hypothetical protein